MWISLCGIVWRLAYIGLNTSAVLTVDDLGVLEDDVCDIVVALAANRTNRQAMAARAVHAAHGYVVAGRDGYTIILVDDSAIGEYNIGVAAEVETITVMSRRQTAGDGVWSITSRVVEIQVIHGQPT